MNYSSGFRVQGSALVAMACVAVTAGAQGFPTAPPAALPVTPAQLPPFQQATLSNGVKLLVVSNHRLPILSIALSFPAGGSYDPAGKAGTAEMVSTLLTKGGGKRDAEAVSAAIEGVGGAMNASTTEDFLTVDVNLLAENAALGFELVGDAVARATFPEKEVDLARTQMLSALQLAQSQPPSIASRVFAAELYGKHPYGRRADAVSVKSVTRDDLVAFQKARLRPTGALLVVAGDITLAQAQQLAEAAFKGWTGAAPAPLGAAATPPARTASEIVLVHRAGSVQSNIVMGNLTWGPADPRAYAIALANKVLGGGGDSRLFMELREKKGWTYGAYSSVNRYKGTGYFTANAEVRTDVTDSSVKEMLIQMRRLSYEQVPTKEFDDAKSALVGRFPLQVETASQVAAQVSTAQLLGLAPDYVQTYRQKLSAQTPMNALDAAKAGIKADAALIVVVGDGAKLYDKLKAIAPVRIVSPDGATLRPEDLVVKGGTLDANPDRLVARTDSFVVYLQDRAFGFQRSKVEKAGAGWKYTEDVNLGPIVQQHTEITFGGDLTPSESHQTAKQGGQDGKIDIVYAANHAKGVSVTPVPGGSPKTVQVDVDVPKGMIDDNMIFPLLPTFKWAADASFKVSALETGKGEPIALTLKVTGQETVTVPAGAINAWKIEVSGAPSPLNFWIEVAAPNRIVKIAIVGQPVEFRLAK